MAFGILFHDIWILGPWQIAELPSKIRQNTIEKTPEALTDVHWRGGGVMLGAIGHRGTCSSSLAKAPEARAVTATSLSENGPEPGFQMSLPESVKKGRIDPGSI